MAMKNVMMWIGQTFVLGTALFLLLLLYDLFPLRMMLDSVSGIQRFGLFGLPVLAAAVFLAGVWLIRKHTQFALYASAVMAAPVIPCLLIVLADLILRPSFLSNLSNTLMALEIAAFCTAGYVWILGLVCFLFRKFSG